MPRPPSRPPSPALAVLSAALAAAASCGDPAAPAATPRPPRALGSGCFPVDSPACSPSPPATVEIISATGPNPDSSFTTLPGERTLTLRARTTPESMADAVTWEIHDDPEDDVHSTAPTAAPPDGWSSSADVPAQSTARWQLPHGTAWTRKALAFKVVAEVPRGVGVNPARDSVVVRQREVDVLRQEYVDFGIVVPKAVDVRRPADVAGLTRFSWQELNQGDYGVAVLTPVLLQKIPEVEHLAGRQLKLNSVFRNPAHQRFHISVSGGGTPAPRGQHQYGAAVDFHTPRDLKAWSDLRDLAKTAGACAEPLNISTLNHVHADWRQGAPNCPKGW